MAINFEQPQAIAPEINASFGRAQQFSQDAPVLQRSVDSLASMYEAQAGRRQQMGMQEAALRQSGAETTARLQAANDARAANAADSWRSQILDRDTQFNMQSNRLNFAAEEANAQRQQQIINMREQAELQNWLGQQEMTQGEQMRLARQQSAVSEVMNDPGLSQQEKQDYVRELRTGIDTGKRRMQKTQEDAMKANTEHVKQQTDIEAMRLSRLAQSIPGRVNSAVEDGYREDMTRIVSQEFDELNPNIGKVPGGQAIRQAAIEAEVRARAEQDGKLHSFIINHNGDTVAIDKGKAGGSGKGPEGAQPFSETDARKQAIAIAEDAFPDDIVKDGKVQLSQEQLDRRNARIAEETNKMRDQWTAANQGGNKRQPWQGTPFAQEKPKPVTPATAYATEVKKNTAFEIGKGNEEQNKTVKFIDDIRAGIRTIPGLDDNAKRMFEEQANTAIKLYRDNGSVPGMSPEEQQLYTSIIQSLKKVALQVPLREDQQPEPARRGFLDRAADAVGRAAVSLH